MNILYVSKALVVAAYREKIRELQRHASVRAVMPERWGVDRPEPSPPGLVEPRRVAARLTGHNHLHHYVRPARWLTDPAPDLAHIDEEPYSLVTLQLARLCRRHRIPFVFFAWQNVDRRLPPPFGRVRAAVLRSAGGGIAGSATAARLLRDAGYAGPLAVIPQFGVDTDRFRPDPAARAATRERLGIPAGAFVVGYAGRLVPEKGVAVLVRAFASLAGGPAAAAPHLLIAGEGPERRGLETLASAAGVAGRVHFTGPIASLDVPRVLTALDVLVLPSVGSRTWAEQFGRVLVEAMACGVPVVGTTTGEIPAVVADAGLLVPPGDPPALAAALDRLRGEPATRDRLAGEGLDRVRQRYTHERIAGATADFYREVLNGGGDR